MARYEAIRSYIFYVLSIADSDGFVPTNDVLCNRLNINEL